MKIAVKIPKRNLTNNIQQHSRRIILCDQLSFIPEVQEQFNIHKSIILKN